MRIYRTFEDIEYNANTILTVGTFDGVHLGHQKVLSELLRISSQESLRGLVVTIHPHPQIVLQKPDKRPVSLLTTIEERLALFEKFGVQDALILNFTREFAQTPPVDFIKNYLIDKIGLGKILIGYDHMFGKDRGGDWELLKSLSSRLNFGLTRIEAMHEGDNIISSTKIRTAINSGHIETANQMLGYNYFVMGRVVQGDKRGKELGYPTANIEPLDSHKLLPSPGVYFVKIDLGQETFYGMAYIGCRPTFTDDKHITLEVNIFEFDRDVYNTEMSVTFLNFIRGDYKFDNVESFLMKLDEDKQICTRLMKSISLNH